MEDGSTVISGNYKFFNELGILIEDENFNEKGNFDGQNKEFNSQGKILSVSEWVDGVNHSEIRYHPITGKIILNT